MAKEYISKGACLQCSLGTNSTNLNVLSVRDVILSGVPMGNISDHISMVNIPSFGRCRSLAYPPTATATAAAHGKLTPMPCIPGTVSNWLFGKDDYLISNSPALKIDSKCRCQFGGIISLKSDGQIGCGTSDVIVEPPLEFSVKEHKFQKNVSTNWSSEQDVGIPQKELTAEEEKRWKRKYAEQISTLNNELILLNNLIAAEDTKEYHTLINNRRTIIPGTSERDDCVREPMDCDTNNYIGAVKDENGNYTVFGGVAKNQYNNVDIDYDTTDTDTNVLIKLLSDLIGMMRPIRNTKFSLIIDFDALIGGVKLIVSFGYDGNIRRYLQLEYSSWIGFNLDLSTRKGISMGEQMRNIANKVGRKIFLVKFHVEFEENVEQPSYDWIETFLFADINLDINSIFEIKFLDEYDTGMETNSLKFEGSFRFPQLDIIIKWDPEKINNGQAGFTVSFSKEFFKDNTAPIGLREVARRSRERNPIGANISVKFGPKFRYTWQLENLMEDCNRKNRRGYLSN